MAVTRQRKQEILQELIDLFEQSKSVVTTHYSGTAVNDINDLRGDMFKANVRLKVAKKTLIRLAAKEAGYDDIPDEVLAGPVALAFSLDDEVAGAKAIKDASEELKGFNLLGGFMEGRILDKESVDQLADIPPFEVLVAQFIRTIKSPITGFHGVLHGTMRNFVGVLNAIKEEQEQGSNADAETEAEEPATEAEEAKADPDETKETEEAKSEESDAKAEEKSADKDEAKAEDESTDEKSDE